MAHRVVPVGHDNDGSRDIFSAILAAHPDLDYTTVVAPGLYCFCRCLDLVPYHLKRDALASRAKTGARLKAFEPGLLLSLFTVHLYKAPSLEVPRVSPPSAVTRRSCPPTAVSRSSSGCWSTASAAPA